MVMAAPQASTIELFLSKINALSLDGGKLSWLPRHIQLGNADHKKRGPKDPFPYRLRANFALR